SVATTARLTAHLGFSTTDHTPPTTTTTFVATASTLGGVPVAPLSLTGAIAPISLAFVESDLAAATLLSESQTAPDNTVHTRLNPDLIDDILFLFTYSTQAQS